MHSTLLVEQTDGRNCNKKRVHLKKKKALYHQDNALTSVIIMSKTYEFKFELVTYSDFAFFPLLLSLA